MRVILDTNVFVSAVFFGGKPGKILKAWRDGEVRLVLSPDILEEYIEVLHRLETRYPPVEADPIIALVLADSEIISVPPLNGPVSLDPGDDKFIACALKSGANLIISGDKHLLTVSGYRGIKVVKPSEFLKELPGRK
jgi:putative PIN family toxin of toxin-antitoxin system